jgi:hypothetical protein
MTPLRKARFAGSGAVARKRLLTPYSPKRGPLTRTGGWGKVNAHQSKDLPGRKRDPGIIGPCPENGPGRPKRKETEMSGKRTGVKRGTALAMAMVLGLGLILGGCASAMVSEVKQTGPIMLQPIQPQPDASKIKSGLAVYYFRNLYKSIYEIPKGKNMLLEGKPGPPLPELNRRFGPEQKIFDSGLDMGVGMFIYGYLRFPKAGEYAFRAMANDGVRLLLNGQMILNDPFVHGDKFTGPTTVTATEAGLYEFQMFYYQRKGTARLELHWQTPDMNAFAPVPPEAYAHLPGKGPLE